jgi:hypothetical protein
MNSEPLVNTSIDLNPEGVRENHIVISDEDKERFFKSVLSDKPYEETIELFGGQHKVRFKSMTVQENAEVVNQITADRQRGVADDTDAYFITIASYRLALSLVSVDGQPFSSITKENFSASTEHDTFVLARMRVILNWATPKLSAYLAAFQSFEAKVIKLTNEAQSPNFWKASA